MNLEVLRKLGLSDGEVKVYSALLQIGISSINKIHEKVGMDRRNIYDILNKLIERGLVAYTEENGKRTFRLTNPNKILSYVEEKKTSLNNIKKEIELILPDMQSAFESKKDNIFSEIFRGPEGMKAVWDDMLNYSTINWIGSGMYVPDRFPAYWKDWNSRRKKAKVKIYHLYRHEKRKQAELGNKDGKMFTAAKFLPVEFSGSPTATAVYGNKVAQLLAGENIFMFVIQSKELADNHRLYFKYLWDHVAKE